EKYQWVQCDNCAKWRKLPMDVLVPPRWSCADNSWDPKSLRGRMSLGIFQKVGWGGYEVETGRGALGTSRREADVASGSGSGSG
ncbi:hypothetical protein AMTR_s00403p00012560, partial [Amborella trichopoda]